MGYIEKTYGRSEKFLAFKVCFYDTKCAAQGLWCSLHGLAVTDDGSEWVEISAC